MDFSLMFNNEIFLICANIQKEDKLNYLLFFVEYYYKYNMLKLKVLDSGRQR